MQEQAVHLPEPHHVLPMLPRSSWILHAPPSGAPDPHYRVQEGKAFDANNKPVPLAGEHKQAELQDVRTAEYMWRAIGADSWVVVPIQSAARPGHVMEGTRLTLVSPVLTLI